MMMNWKYGTAVAAMAAMMTGSVMQASQLSGDARASIPKDVQQIIVVDYKAMQNSPAAMQLKDRVLPPELKRLETALRTSGLKVDQDCETLAFAAFRAGSGTPNRTSTDGARADRDDVESARCAPHHRGLLPARARGVGQARRSRPCVGGLLSAGAPAQSRARHARRARCSAGIRDAELRAEAGSASK